MAVLWEEQRRLEEPEAVEDRRDRVRVRSAGERDRDRVLYSSAFQRLAGVTQVVPAGTGQAVHTRLTHSLKVGQVARRLAQRLIEKDGAHRRELDPDSVEAAALVHDLGHPPFGHIAEKELNAFALEHDTDGFEGNAQSFRLATRLAQRWPPEREGDDLIEWGLNLSRRTLDGVLKYPWLRTQHVKKKRRKWGAYATDKAAFEWVREKREVDEPCPAARVMDWADDLTYAVHDMEDFYRAGLVPLDRLCTSMRERERFILSMATPDARETLEKFEHRQLEEATHTLFGDLLDFVDPYSGTRSQRMTLRERTSFLIRRYLHAMDDDFAIDPVHSAEVAVLKQLTWYYVIRRQELATVQEGQRRVIEALCARFWNAVQRRELEMFPPLEREMLEGLGDDEPDQARLVCDFVARLTEPRALELHQRMIGASVAVLPPPAH